MQAGAPELRLVDRWLDSWSGIGLIVVAMAHQGYQVSLGDHGAGRWITVFYHGGGGHRPVEAAATAQEPTPWARGAAGGVGGDQAPRDSGIARPVVKLPIGPRCTATHADRAIRRDQDSARCRADQKRARGKAGTE
jgi:hypothetical protein